MKIPIPDSAGAGIFVKALADGEELNVVFRGEPVHFYKVFNESTKRSTEYPTLEDVPKGVKSSIGFKTNVASFIGGKFFPQIFSFSTQLATQINLITGKFGDDYIYTIIRSGVGQKTTYSLMPNRPLTEDESIILENMPLREIRIGGEK